jgi:hypothetical protein
MFMRFFWFFFAFLWIFCRFWFIFFTLYKLQEKLGLVSHDEMEGGGGSTFLGRKGGGSSLNFDPVRPMI